MREYARSQTGVLLRRFAYQAARVSRDCGAEAVHDLRVSIRRLNRCLRTFADFYPGHAWKRIRRKLRALMEAAGAVRDRDIALVLMAAAGLPADSPGCDALRGERDQAAARLAAALAQWRQNRYSRRWREELGL